MKRPVGIAAVAAAALMLTGEASAQKGKFKGFFEEMGKITLLTSADVQKDLKLSDEQVTKLKEIATKQKDARDPNLDKQERFTKFKEIMEDGKKVLDDLTEQQKKRLGQLRLQQMGAGALFQLAEKLDLSEDQQGKLKEVFKEFRPKFGEAFKEFKDDKEARDKKFAELTKEQNVEAMKILNDDQKAKFKEMQGPKFKGTLPPGFGFGFGMGRGMGGNETSLIETSRIEAVTLLRRWLL